MNEEELKRREKEKRDGTVDKISTEKKNEKPTVVVNDPKARERPEDPKEYLIAELRELKRAQQQYLANINNINGQIVQLQEMAKRMKISLNDLE